VKKLLFVILCISLIFVFIIYSTSCIPAAADALFNCFKSVFPAIFPFLVLTEMLNRTNLFSSIGNKTEKIARIIFKTSGNALSVICIGFLCGFPGAAKVTADFYNNGRISYSDAVRLSTFTNNPGPLFMVGTVGVVFLDSALLGFQLFAVQILSSFITGIILSHIINIESTPPVNKKNNKILPQSSLGIFTESINTAVLTMLPIIGTIVFFAFFSEAIISSNIIASIVSLIFPPNSAFLTNCIIRCVFELTGGLTAVIPLLKGSCFLLPGVSLICSWSGIAIHIQVTNFYIKENLPVKFYFIGKLIQSTLSTVLTVLIL